MLKQIPLTSRIRWIRYFCCRSANAVITGCSSHLPATLQVDGRTTVSSTWRPHRSSCNIMHRDQSATIRTGPPCRGDPSADPTAPGSPRCSSKSGMVCRADTRTGRLAGFRACARAGEDGHEKAAATATADLPVEASRPVDAAIDVSRGGRTDPKIFVEGRHLVRGSRRIGVAVLDVADYLELVVAACANSRWLWCKPHGLRPRQPAERRGRRWTSWSSWKNCSQAGISTVRSSFCAWRDFSVQTEPARPGRDDGGTRLVAGTHDHHAMGSALHAGVREALAPICPCCWLVHGVLTSICSRSEASGATSIVPLIGRVGQSTSG